MKHTAEQITDMMRQIQPAALGTDIVSAGAVKNVVADENSVAVEVVFGFPAASVVAGFERRIEQLVQPLLANRELSLSIGWEVRSHTTQGQTRPRSEEHTSELQSR